MEYKIFFGECGCNGNELINDERSVTLCLRKTHNALLYELSRIKITMMWQKFNFIKFGKSLYPLKF